MNKNRAVAAVSAAAAVAPAFRRARNREPPPLDEHGIAKDTTIRIISDFEFVDRFIHPKFI